MTAPGGPAAAEQPGADRAAFLRWASGMPTAANRSLVVVTDGEGFLPLVYPVGALTDTDQLQLFLDEAPLFHQLLDHSRHARGEGLLHRLQQFGNPTSELCDTCANCNASF